MFPILKSSKAVLFFSLSLPALLLLFSCKSQYSPADSSSVTEESLAGINLYSNPVMNANIPDPTVIKAPDGTFYAVGTGANVFRSLNMVDWERVGKAFEKMPSWLTSERGTGRVWACDVNHVGGKYVMYYALSEWDELDVNGIGAAVSDKPQGPYKDLGKMFTSSEKALKYSKYFGSP